MAGLLYPSIDLDASKSIWLPLKAEGALGKEVFSADTILQRGLTAEGHLQAAFPEDRKINPMFLKGNPGST